MNPRMGLMRRNIANEAVVDQDVGVQIEIDVVNAIDGGVNDGEKDPICFK